MDNSIFKSLTCGVTFKKQNLKRKQVKPGFQAEAKEEIKEVKIESDSEDEVHSFSKKPAAKKSKKMTPEYLYQKQLEDTSKIRKQHQINVKGSVATIKPIESFSELFQRFEIDEKLKENIKNFKYSTPTPVQMQILPIFLEKKALKVVAPTGSGNNLQTLICVVLESTESFILHYQEKPLRLLFLLCRIYWMKESHRQTTKIRFKQSS